MHDAQRHTVWEIKGDTKRGKRVMTYSEMCESQTNKRRTLTERVFEQQTATTILEGTPDTPTLVSYFFLSNFFRHPSDRDRRSSHPQLFPSSYY